MPNNFNCLIFDFDGTLADTHIGIVRTFQETFRTMGFEVPSEEKITSTIGLTLKDGVLKASEGMSDDDADRAVVEYRRIFPDIAYPLTTAFPEVIDTLEEIRRRGIRMAIATSRSHASLNDLAEQIGVKKFFECMMAAEDVAVHKPAPDLALKTMNEMNASPSETLVIGDATYDLLMGRNAGCRVCGVTWGNQSRQQLETAGPDYIIDSISGLLEIV